MPLILIRLLGELARAAPPAFLCHYYNVYFAHTAGGRMIGAKVASMILDGQELAFYKVTLRMPMPALHTAHVATIIHLPPRKSCVPVLEHL